LSSAQRQHTSESVLVFMQAETYNSGTESVGTVKVQNYFINWSFFRVVGVF